MEVRVTATNCEARRSNDHTTTVRIWPQCTCMPGRQDTGLLIFCSGRLSANLSVEIVPTLGLYELYGRITAVFIENSDLKSQIIYVSDLNRN